MAKLNLIERSWQNFSAAISLDDDDVPDLQRAEMHRAFFAGAGCMFNLMLEIVGRDPDTPEPGPAEVLLLSQLQAELRAFSREQGCGCAVCLAEDDEEGAEAS